MGKIVSEKMFKEYGIISLVLGLSQKIDMLFTCLAGEIKIAR